MPRNPGRRRRTFRRAKATPQSKHVHSFESFDLDIEPVGPTAKQVDSIRQSVLGSTALRQVLGTARHRLLGLEWPALEQERKPQSPEPGPERFIALVYDYTSDRTLLAEGAVRAPSRVTITETALQPLPSDEEFAAAVALLRRDGALSGVLGAGQVVPYRPMPPLVGEELPDGRRRRVIAVGLLPREGHNPHEIVGVRLGRSEIVRFETGAPAMALAGPAGICGVPNAGQPTASGVAGQVWITVKRGREVLWRFLAVRPAASSGTNGSGVELRYVDYRGKRLLYRAHVPFLNVKYDGDACGPYRDWQNQEGMIHAVGTDIAPGFRLCTSPPTTVLQSGDDTGNFLGTAIYVAGDEVVLVCEMEAGWYRYVSEWRLHADGTIRPRFGFGAVSSSCVCSTHHHHVYWRLDFDLRTPGSNTVREFNDPPLVPGSKWHVHQFETRRRRDPGRKRKWRVVNTVTREAYDIVPGASDGVAATAPDAPFGRGDVWITRWRGTEIDDGVVAIGPPYEADIDRFVNGELVRASDVVVWYGAHFTHDVHRDAHGTHGHTLGPDLKRVRW